MKFPTLPTVPSITRRPTEYAAGLTFVATETAKELGAGISGTLEGLLVALAAFITTGVVELVNRKTVDPDDITAEDFLDSPDPEN
mgnify:CR=1 FL=1